MKYLADQFSFFFFLHFGVIFFEIGVFTIIVLSIYWILFETADV